MANQELSITVGELLGIVKVSLNGQLSPRHDQALQGVLNGLQEQGSTSLVLDLAGLTSSGTDAATGLINVLRSLGSTTNFHVVASGALGSILSKSGFGPSVRVYSSVDDIADMFSDDEEYLTSRWMARGSQDTELPLAA
ncbi:STAS domain-containing protein [bacterium]|nr:STAS domain-containing protein [bacterium]